MKIMHASIPADDPRRAAEVIAELFSGEALPFPPAGPDGWMAWSGDGSIELEIVPRGHVLHFGSDEGEWKPGEPQKLSEAHLAIGVERSAQQILEIAHKAGWPARICSRGDGLFELVEVWVEGFFMLELFDPDQTAVYERTITIENWKRFTAQAAA